MHQAQATGWAQEALNVNCESPSLSLRQELWFLSLPLQGDVIPLGTLLTFTPD